MHARVNETTNDLLMLFESGGFWYLRPSRMPLWGDRPIVKCQGVEIYEGADYVVEIPSQWFWRVKLVATPPPGAVFSMDYYPIGGAI